MPADPPIIRCAVVFHDHSRDDMPFFVMAVDVFNPDYEADTALELGSFQTKQAALYAAMIFNRSSESHLG